MIELRWGSFFEIDPDAGEVGEVHVLQYRVQTNLLEVGIQAPIWSGWINVPIVDIERPLEGGEKSA